MKHGSTLCGFLPCTLTPPRRRIMTNRAAQNLAALDHETGRLLETVDSLGAQSCRPTLCEDWDAAHLLTHLARNADSLLNLVRWASDGVERQAYASEERREADIEEGARRPWGDIVSDLRASAERFRTAAEILTGPAGENHVRTRTGTAVRGSQLPAMRVLEVVFHHVDLRAGFTFDDADPAWVMRTLTRGARQWSSHEPDTHLTLVARDGALLTVGQGGPEVHGSPGQLLLWLARGHSEGLTHDGTLPDPPAWA